MSEINLPPFYAGQKVIAVKSFKKLRKTWRFNYPSKNDIVTVVSIRKHPLHAFWLITIAKCECELCHKCFAPVEEKFETISYEKVIKQEKPLICPN